MTSLLNPRLWLGRTLILSCVIVAPFVSFLIRQRYGVTHLESAGLVAILLLVCALLAGLPRGWIFQTLVLIGVGFNAATPLAHALPSWMPAPAPVCFAAAIVMACGAAFLLGNIAFPVLAIYCVSFLAAGFVTPADASPGQPVHPARPAHILHLILDEHIGLAGLPAHVPRCAEAAPRIAGMLAAHRFAVFPNAYSNYAMTVDSLPATLNGRLANHSYEFAAPQHTDGARAYRLTANRLAAHLSSRGYDLSVVQHQALDLSAGLAQVASKLEYADQLNAIAHAEGNPLAKAEWVVSRYQASDPVLRLVNGFFPFRIGGRMTGPLALSGIWPTGVLQQIRSASKPTYFLVHLLIPHAPYVYRADGTLRPIDEWARDGSGWLLAPAAWESGYARYCDQASYLASALGGFFDELERAGLFQQMTIVVHGDHGSRIRAATAERGPQRVSPEVYDYANSPPPLRDLLDRFSALAAVKTPQATVGRTVLDKVSLIRFFEGHVPFWPPGPPVAGADQVFLFDPVTHLSRAIPILDAWR